MAFPALRVPLSVVLFGLLLAALLLPAAAPAQGWRNNRRGNAGPAAAPDTPSAPATPTSTAPTRPASGRDPATLYHEGLAAFQNGDYAKCNADLSEFLSVFGSEPEYADLLERILFAKACATYNLPDYETAAADFTAYLAKFPESEFAPECAYRIATALLQLDRHDDAIEAFRRVCNDYPSSPYVEDSAYSIAFCELLRNRNAAAAEAFAAFMDRYPESPLWAQAGAFAARATFDDGRPADAIRLLSRIEDRPMSWSVVTYCNFLAFEIGDALFDDTEYALALKAYRRIKTRAALLRHQRAYADSLTAELDSLRASPAYRKDPRAAFRRERRLASDLQQARELADRLAKLPDYDVNLYHRIGRCFFNSDHYWEARVAFARVVQLATDPAVKEAAHFDLVLAISRLRRAEDLLIEADRYLATYDPAGDWH
jgi:TolA-binding protein